MCVTYLYVNVWGENGVEKIERFKMAFRDVRDARWICFFFAPHRKRARHNDGGILRSRETSRRRAGSKDERDYVRGTFANRSADGNLKRFSKSTYTLLLCYNNASMAHDL